MESTPEPDKNNSNFWKEVIQLVLLSLIIVIPFRLYVAQPFIVDGASMYPTFETGNYLIIDELSYNFKQPERGSVLVFKYPKNPKKSFIKRIIGLPGETVSISDGQVTIINAIHPEGFILNEPYIELSKKDNSNNILGPEEYFVLGDNRLESSDSRNWGAVPKNNFVGRPLVRLFPPAIFPGDQSAYLKTQVP